MKQTNPLKRLLLTTVAIVGLSASLAAQTSPPTPTFRATAPDSYGLLGQNYGSLDFAYINHKSGPPDLLHSYGMVYNTAIAPGFDTSLKYHYFTGSEFGGRYRNHEALASATAYVPLSWARPFVEGNAGWV